MWEKIKKLRKHRGFKKYAANTGWMFAEQFLRMVAGLLVGVWVARYLGPVQFGIFNYTLAFVAIFAGVAKLGLDNVVVRDLVNKPEETDIYLGTAFWLKVIGGAGTFVIVAISTLAAGNDAITNCYILIIASGIICQSFEVVDFYFQSRVMSKFVSLCKMIQLLTTSLLKIFFILTGSGLFCFVVLSVIDQAVIAIAYFIAYRSQNDRNNFYLFFDMSIARKLLSDSWPLIFSGMTVAIYMKMDQIMIKMMLGEREVGLFSAAIKIPEILYLIPALVSNSLFPAILNARKVNFSCYYGRLQKMLSMLVWLAIVIALPMTFCSNWLVTLVYGQAYQGAGQVLMIAIWAGIFVAMGVVSNLWFMAENLPRLAFYRTLYGAIASILLNIVLIPIYGIKGAALAMLFSQILASWGSDLLNETTRPMFFVKAKSFLITRSLFQIRSSN